MLKLIFILTLSSIAAFAEGKPESVDESFEKLGGNDSLYETARSIQGQTEIQIVQNRTVNRIKRWEIAPSYENFVGGDPYSRPEGYGLNVHYHFNPRISLGIKSSFMANKLTPEGSNLINDVSASGSGIVPDIDYLKQQNLVQLDWYPLYGKVAFLNSGVTQFDIYSTVGVGTVELKSGNTQTWTAGVGLGLWLSQHLTTRAEVRYQTFTAKDYETNKKMDMTVLGLQVGYLL